MLSGLLGVVVEKTFGDRTFVDERIAIADKYLILPIFC